jgi:hypothetical protein
MSPSILSEEASLARWSAWHQSASSHGEQGSYRQILLERGRERREIRKGKEGEGLDLV